MTDIIVDGLALSVVRHGDAPAGATPVIYVHGATFPSALAVNWRFADGHSWADDLADAGHDPWSFDFAGYGGSARYTEMAVEAVPGPLGRSDLAVRQLAAVVDHVRSHTGAAKVVLLAHSWGGVVASRCAAEYPDGIEKLVLFAPIIRRETPDPPDGKALPGWMPMPLAAQIKRFREDVPAGEDELISDAMFAAWGAAYLATDPLATSRTPPAVAIPVGPQADSAAIWSGLLPYDPARITCAVSIVRGAWDSLCTNKDVAWFEAALTSCPRFSDTRLARGTHLMHLESGRGRLWAATRNALAAMEAPRAHAMSDRAEAPQYHPPAERAGVAT